MASRRLSLPRSRSNEAVPAPGPCRARTPAPSADEVAARRAPARFLMCPPAFLGVDTAANPWAASRFTAKRGLASRQWEQLRDTLACLAGTEVLAPLPGLPGMAFTANAGLVHGRRVVLSRFRRAERRAEAGAFRSWFERQGYEVIDLPEPLCFEGQGEMLPTADGYVAGHLLDDDVAAHRWISERLEVPVRSLRLTDPRFHHLDTCLCPLGPGLAAYHPPAFEPAARAALAEHYPRLLEIAAPEALRLAANAVVVGDRVVLGDGCPRFERVLEAHGLRVSRVRLSEFLLEGGGPKCLALELDRPQITGVERAG